MYTVSQIVFTYFIKVVIVHSGKQNIHFQNNLLVTVLIICKVANWLPLMFNFPTFFTNYYAG